MTGNFDLREYLDLARKWLWLFVLSSAVAAVAAWLATLGMPRQYASQTTLLVGRAAESANPNFQEIYLTQSLAQLYASMATRQPVLERAVGTLGLQASWQQLRGLVKAAPVPGSSLIEIRVIDTDPQRAPIVADAVARSLIAEAPGPDNRERDENEAFVDTQITTLRTSIERASTELADIEAQIGLASSARAIADLEARKRAREQQIESWDDRLANYLTFSKGGEANSLRIIEAATPAAQVGPNVRMNVLFAALLGFGLALGAVLLLEYLDDTVKTADQFEKRLGLVGLATIEMVQDVHHRSDTLLTKKSPRSPVAEAFRVLRTNLEFALVDRETRCVVVTSPNPGEGKSTVAANLAVVMAQGGARVVLVDTDLRRPSLHRFFGFANSVGLTSLLLDDDLPLDTVCQRVEEVPGLSVVTSGPLPPNPAEVLKSPRIRHVLDRLSNETDVLVLDSPPLLVVADASILSQRVDGTVLVLECGSTRTDAARKAVEVLKKVGVTPIGAVVNKLERRRVGGYYYYYQYSYRYRYGEYYGSDHRDDDEGTKGSGGTTTRRHRHGHRGRSVVLDGPWPGALERVRRGVIGLLG